MCKRCWGSAFRNSIIRGVRRAHWTEGADELQWGATATSANNVGSSGASVAWGVVLSQGKGPEVCTPGTQRFLNRCLPVSSGPALPAAGEISDFILDVWMAHCNISPVRYFIKAVRLTLSVPCCKGGTQGLWNTYEAIISHLGHRAMWSQGQLLKPGFEFKKKSR